MYIDHVIDVVKKTPVSDENNCSINLAPYTNEKLTKLAADLLVRCNKWLGNGYRNDELISFIARILVHTNDTKRLDKLEANIVASKNIPNTHKFMF